jgi:hypothetical protein
MSIISQLHYLGHYFIHSLYSVLGRNISCCFVIMTLMLVQLVADICTGAGPQSGGTAEEACGV